MGQTKSLHKNTIALIPNCKPVIKGNSQPLKNNCQLTVKLCGCIPSRRELGAEEGRVDPFLGLVGVEN